MPTPQRRVQIVAASLFIAIVANGLLFWCRKMGWADAERWTTFLAANPDWWSRRLSPAENAALADFIQLQYQHDSGQVWLKRIKDLWLVLATGLLCAGLVASLRDKLKQNPYKDLLQSKAFAIAAAGLTAFLASLIYGIVSGNAMLVTAGVYSLIFTACAAALGYRPQYQQLPYAISYVLLALLLANAVCVALEISLGQRLFPGDPLGLNLNGRAVGLLLQPSSLGATSVLSVVWIRLFLPTPALRPWLPGLWLLSLGLVIASASAIAVIMWVLALLLLLSEQAKLTPTIKLLATLGLAAVLLAILLWLPELLGRTHLPKSLLERVDVIGQILKQELQGLELFIGAGWGHGSNAAAALGIHYNSDSTIALLLHQFGLLGLLLAYGLVVLCCFYARRTRDWLVLASLASLTINVTELFPVNVLLGIVLGLSLHQAANPKDSPQPHERSPRR